MGEGGARVAGTWPRVHMARPPVLSAPDIAATFPTHHIQCRSPPPAPPPMPMPATLCDPRPPTAPVAPCVAPPSLCKRVSRATSPPRPDPLRPQPPNAGLSQLQLLIGSATNPAPLDTRLPLRTNQKNTRICQHTSRTRKFTDHNSGSSKAVSKKKMPMTKEAASALRRLAVATTGRVARLFLMRGRRAGADAATTASAAAMVAADRARTAQHSPYSPLRMSRAHSSTQVRKVVAAGERGVWGRVAARALGDAAAPAVAAATASAPAPAQGPQRTPLYELHVEHGGKMVPFAGFLLPVSYAAQGIAASHLHARRHAALFDVSHMMQTEIRGKDGVEFLESICTADLQGLADNASVLTVFTDPITGGILDDLIVTKTPLGYLHVVSNAARRAHDQKLMLQAEREFLRRGKDVALRFFDAEERALLALQGPAAARALQALADVDLPQLRFMASTLATVAGVPRVRVTRCGYTGEDGVELAVPGERAAHVAQALLASRAADVQLAGLGARDSLRIEAGLCLYGNDIDHTTTPVEAGLSWVIGKRRRQAADFPGASLVLRQLREGPGRRRVGLRAVAGGPPFRAGARLYAQDAAAALASSEPVGIVTSGCPSPSLGVNIAMGYVSAALAKAGTRVAVEVRGQAVEAEVVKMPFVPSNYYQSGK